VTIAKTEVKEHKVLAMIGKTTWANKTKNLLGEWATLRLDN
jgi:hypothetical protein